MNQYRPSGLLLPAIIRILNWFALGSPLSSSFIIYRIFGKGARGRGALDIFLVLIVVAAGVANLLPSPPAWWAIVLPVACVYLLLNILVAGLRVIFSATSDAFAVDDPRRTFC
jgi:hypothetical protein